MTFFVIRPDGIPMIVSGLTQNQAEGYGYQIVDEATYNASVIAHTPTPPTAQQITDAFRTQAYDLVNSDVGPSGKALRGLILVLIDELNVLRQRDRDRSVDVAASTTLADLKIRWAARSSLNDRDITQVKPAIQAKIVAGTAD